jgi:hypothetical protein
MKNAGRGRGREEEEDEGWEQGPREEGRGGSF